MSTTTEDLGPGFAFLAQAVERGRHAEKAVGVLQQQAPAPAQAFEVLLAALADVPRLVALAERGLLDAALIRQHAGHQERADRVRELHLSLEMPGSRLICRHCRAEWPCPTLVCLDG